MTCKIFWKKIHPIECTNLLSYTIFKYYEEVMRISKKFSMYWLLLRILCDPPSYLYPEIWNFPIISCTMHIHRVQLSSYKKKSFSSSFSLRFLNYWTDSTRVYVPRKAKFGHHISSTSLEPQIRWWRERINSDAANLLIRNLYTLKDLALFLQRGHDFFLASLKRKVITSPLLRKFLY